MGMCRGGASRQRMRLNMLDQFQNLEEGGMILAWSLWGDRRLLGRNYRHQGNSGFHRLFFLLCGARPPFRPRPLGMSVIANFEKLGSFFDFLYQKTNCGNLWLTSATTTLWEQMPKDRML